MDRTIRLFDTDAYGTDFEATVLDTVPAPEGLALVLDRTFFFPEEGGQSPDTGTLAGYPVTDVQIRDEIITHTIRVPEQEREEAAARLSAGQRVRGCIDWERRFSNMQNHTGEHILSGLMHRLYGFDNVGFHLSDNNVTLDVNGQLDRGQLDELEREANRVVWRNVPVTAQYPAPEELAGLDYRSKKEIEGDVRIVTIEGVDCCACCAPHVSRTGEIGQIRIVRVQHEKSKMRLFIVCGARALSYAQHSLKEAEQISHLLNLPPEDIAAGTVKLKEEQQTQYFKMIGLQARYLTLRVREALSEAGSAPDVFLFEEELDRDRQREAVNLLCESLSGYGGIFAGTEEDGYFYIIGAGTAKASDAKNTAESTAEPGDARRVNALLKERLSARGGGSAQMVQGSIRAPKEEILAALN